jgi:hypothetical protein
MDPNSLPIPGPIPNSHGPLRSAQTIMAQQQEMPSNYGSLVHPVGQNRHETPMPSWPNANPTPYPIPAYQTSGWDYYGRRPKIFTATYLNAIIPDVDLTAGPMHDGKKLIFAETVNKYTRNPSVSQNILEDIVRNKIGKYATQVWYDKYLQTQPRMPFLDAFKQRWLQPLNSDDYNKLIQGYEFHLEHDALQMGLVYERDFQPFLELAERAYVRITAEGARVARFRKILGPTLMTQLIHQHPAPFTTVDEMLVELKRLNDTVGIPHYADPSEAAYDMMGIL